MLTSADRSLLAIEARTYAHRGAHEQAIYEETGLSPTRAYQRLNQLISVPAAWEHAPSTMARLDRQRAARARSRR